MLFEKKTVSQLVDEFKMKVQERENKISSNVALLRTKVEGIRKTITANTAEMIEKELANDTAGAQKLSKANLELQSEVQQLSDKIQAYESVGGSNSDHSKELAEIQKAAIREMKEKDEKDAAMRARKEEIKKEIQTLEAEDKKLSLDLQYSHGPEREVERIIKFINPKLVQSGKGYHEDQFLRHWVRGENAEQLYIKQPERKADISDSGEIKQMQMPSKQQIYTARIQTHDRPKAFEDWKRRNPSATIVEVGSLMDMAHEPLEIKYTLKEGAM